MKLIVYFTVLGALSQAIAEDGVDTQKALSAKAEKLTAAAAKLRRANPGAEGDTQSGVQRKSIQWTIDPKDCPLVRSKLTGRGESKLVVSSQINEDGTTLIDATETVSGTATAEDGKKYIFTYLNNVGIPDANTSNGEPVPPFTFVGPDTFELIPVDGGQGYRIVQYFRLRINPGGGATDLGTLSSANSACDPI